MMPVNPATSSAKSRTEVEARGTVNGYGAEWLVAKERAPQKTVRIPENKIGCKILADAGSEIQTESCGVAAIRLRV